MKKSEWSDKHLEDLLRQLPKFHDDRQQHDIYQRMIEKRSRTKRFSWLFPSIAVAAASFLFLVLAPNSLNTLKGLEARDSLKNSSSSTQLGREKRQMVQMAAEPLGKQRLDTQNLKTAVYENDVGNGRVLTYWIPDRQAQMLVPVSAVVHHPGNKSRLELFKEKMPRLREKEWGLSDYYPVQAELKPDGQSNSIIVDVSGTDRYRQGAAAGPRFIQAMEENISSNSEFKKIKFTTDGKPGILLGNEGKKTEIDLKFDRNKAYFLYNPDRKKVPFLVPSMKRFTNIQSALAAMHHSQPNIGLTASLPPEFSIEFNAVKNKTLYLTINGKHVLTNKPATIYSYEAILLTAKEFGFESVKLKNPNIKKLGPFDLSEKTKVPIAANLRQIEDQP